MKLQLFNDEAGRELIEESIAKEGLRLSPGAVDRILELGGGHPFFLQVVGYWSLELQSTKGALLERKDFEIVAQTVRGQVESHFAYYWKHLSPQERHVLAALPLTQGEEIYREELDALLNLCLIVEDDGGYRYFSPLLREFVRRQEVETLLQAGPFVLALPGQRALLREEPLDLSPRQFALLSYFMKRQGQVVSSEELDRQVIAASIGEQGDYHYLGDERLKSALRDLRKALGAESNCIVNKRGVGYMLQIESDE